MTQQDNWQPEMARLAQRQDQLERQQRETTTRGDALSRDADSGIENLRWNADLRLKDMEWNADLRLKDLGHGVPMLERFRGFTESLLNAIMIGCGVALAIFIVTCRRSPAPRERTTGGAITHFIEGCPGGAGPARSSPGGTGFYGPSEKWLRL